MCDVLVLDDDPAIRLAIAETLRDERLLGEEAADLGAAERVLAAGPCSLLLADHDLGPAALDVAGSVDGFSFARDVLKRRPDVAVIYMTARAELLEQVSLSPRERTLRKPFGVERLLAHVRALRAA